MIYKWNELKYPDFKEIFLDFIDGVDWADNKIMEIQDPVKTAIGQSDNRIFFGKQINIYDYKDYNQAIINTLSALSSICPDGVFDESMLVSGTKLSMCLLDKKNGPCITPLVTDWMNSSMSSEEQMNVVFGPSFGETDKVNKYMSEMVKTPLILWYTKAKDGKKVVDMRYMSGKYYKPSEKFVRFRTLDFEDWQKLISKVIAGDDISYFTNKDLSRKELEFKA